MRNKIILGGGYAWVFMHARETICDVVILSSSVIDSTIKGHTKVFLSSKLLAIWRSLHESEQGFVICQEYKLKSSQLHFKKV